MINLLKLLKQINKKNCGIDIYYINLLKNKIDGVETITNKQYKLTKKNLYYHALINI
jgi:hypothetical protein